MVIAAASTVHGGGFVVDMDKKAVFDRFKVYTVADLTVGESALVKTSPGLCLADDGKTLKYPAPARVVGTRSDYGSYYKVTRGPGGTVAIGLEPSKSRSKGDMAKSLAIDIHDWMGKCSTIENLFGYRPADFLSVTEVDGASSLSELLNK